MRYTRRYNTGGNFFTNNIPSFIQLGLGAATANPALIATGGAGLLSSTFNKNQELEQDNTINDWIINNRQHNINSRHTPYSMFLETGGRMQRVSKMRPEPQGVSKVPGGQLQQEASNAFVARGNSHEQGGIHLPGGEVENNETIVNSPITGETEVHSDELGYSDQTNQLADEKGKLEVKLQQFTKQMMALQGEMDNLNKQVEDPRLGRFEKNKNKREFDKVAKVYNDVEFEAMSIQDKIQQIDMMIEQNFQQQEQEAEMMGMRDEQGMPVQDEQRMFNLGGPMGYSDPWSMDAYDPNIHGTPPIGFRVSPGYYDNLKASLQSSGDTSNWTPPTVSGSQLFNNRSVPATPANPISASNPLDNRSVNIPSRIPMRGSTQSAARNLMDNFTPGNWLDPIEGKGEGTVGSNRQSPSKNQNNDLGINLENMTPFISNMANMFFNRKLDNLNAPKGQMLATPTMDATVNINPQLENIQGQTAAYDEFIRSNVAGGPTARAAHAANRVSNIRGINEIRGEQTNVERGIRNQNLGMAAEIGFRNQQTDFTNQLAEHQKEVSSVERASANIANIESKLQQFISQGRMEDYQNQQIELAKLLVDGTSIGVELDQILGLFKTEDELKQALKANGISLESEKGIDLLQKYNNK